MLAGLRSIRVLFEAVLMLDLISKSTKIISDFQGYKNNDGNLT
jgi:hypothetical protein